MTVAQLIRDKIANRPRRITADWLEEALNEVADLAYKKAKGAH